MKTVIITGGASEIGEKTAIEFAKRHYNIILTYLSHQEACSEISRRIAEEYSVDVRTMLCDLQQEESILQLVAALKKDFSTIDVLVNNAAVCYDCLYHEKNKRQFMDTLEVNVVGTFLISKLIGEEMYQNKRGSIINLSSTNGMGQYYPMSLDYDASKAALLSLTNNLALAYSPYVRVNAVCPGFIGTKKELEGLDQAFIESEEEKIFLRRVGTAEEVAKVVWFLASDEASYVNNSILKVDGGMRG